MVDPTESRRVLDALAGSRNRGPALRSEAMQLLSKLPGYDWSGIYRLERDTLVLDAYVGAATEHTRIPVGRGVCGTAVATGENQLVEDVRTLDNYLACSLSTRSEIVVLIRKDGAVVGQIDVDGHEVGAFDATDEALLESMAATLATRWDG